MAGAPTQFGIDEEQLPQAVAVVKAFPLLEVKGFHFHSMSNNLDEEVHADCVGLCLYKADDWSERWEIPLQVVNVGGGMGIDYRAPERSFSWERFAFHLNQVIERAKKCPTLIFEPGRSLVAPCGVYASEVWDLKCNHGQHFVVLRGGSHHFRLPAAWKHNHPFVVLPIERWDEPYSRPEVRQVPVTVAGELCTPNDVLAREVMVERVRVGDILLFLYAGAYGWEISHYQFLSHPRPQMIFFGQ
jgi:diaminopimelate decarboxylase